MSNIKEILKNTGTIISLFGLGGLLLNQFGLGIDLVWLDTTIKLVCSILVLLGICNNPSTKGVDNPFIKKEGEK